MNTSVYQRKWINPAGDAKYCRKFKRAGFPNCLMFKTKGQYKITKKWMVLAVPDPKTCWKWDSICSVLRISNTFSLKCAICVRFTTLVKYNCGISFCWTNSKPWVHPKFRKMEKVKKPKLWLSIIFPNSLQRRLNFKTKTIVASNPKIQFEVHPRVQMISSKVQPLKRKGLLNWCM